MIGHRHLGQQRPLGRFNRPMLDMTPLLGLPDRPMLNRRPPLRLWDRPPLWRRFRRTPLDDLERRRFQVHEFLADLRPESVIAEGAPDNGGDIFRCESDPQIGALGAAIQRHVSDRPKSDVRAQAPAGRWWLNPWLSALRDWICIMRPVSSEP